MAEAQQYIRRSEKRTSPIYSGGLALGMIIGFGGGVVSVLGFDTLFGGNPFAQPGSLIGLIATFAALTSSLIALLALTEQRRARQAGTDPVLVAHFSQRENARAMIMLSISNVGAGAAMNVRMEVAADFDPENYDILTNVFERHETFRTLIQNQSISFNFGVGFKLLGDNPVPPFIVKLHYEDIEGGEYEGVFRLNVKELEKLGSDSSLEQRYTEATEKICKSVDQISSGTTKLHVLTQDVEHYRKEIAELREEQRAMIANSKKQKEE